jgi:hypothetical protein
MAENQPYHTVTLFAGANYDGNIELSFMNGEQGIYVDGHNVQPTSNDGETKALEKIKGEEILYPNTLGSVGYICSASEVVNEYLIEFWTPLNPSFPAIVRVNGIVVLSTDKYPLKPQYPLQWDKNRAKEFSEIFVTDNQPGNPPYIFDIKDMLDSVSTPKYFTAFDPLLYQVNLQSPLDIAVFIEMVNVGGGGGLPPGHYQYQIRYASKAGDRTQWSQATPMIPVVQAISESSKQYPWVKTYGGPPNPSFGTAFAPRLRFRVTNLYNYDFIEVKRTSYNQGAGINYTPNGKIVARIDIGAGEISVKDYIDPAGSNEDIALSAEDESRELAHIDSAKNIRYFDRRLVMMNVTLASREANLTFLEINGRQGFPVIDNLDKAGYNDPWNHTYRRSEMRGEKRGFAINLYDGVGNQGYATKIPQLTNFQFPNRRDPISPETAQFSLDGTVKAADSTCSAVSQTHEVFDHVKADWKRDKCEFKNIVERGRIIGFSGTKLVAPYGVNQDCHETDAEIENHGANVQLKTNVSTAYHPYHPVQNNDPDVTGHNYQTNNKVSKGNVNVNFIVDETKDVHNYSPSIFGPTYYSMGMMIAGVQNFPPWAKSFSVVATKPAGRVVCQGIGYYSLTKAHFNAIGNSGLGGKETNRMWFYAPDIENGIVSSESITDIIDNPQNYNIQFVSPLGFCSEWYSAEFDAIASQRDRCIDMISYVRLLRDHESNPNIQENPFEDLHMGFPGGDGFNYVMYDKYRNISNIPSNFHGNPDKGNRIFDISGTTRKTSGRGSYLEIETIGDFYASGNVGGNSEAHFEDDGLKNWTEPIYIVNIIRKGAEVNDEDIQKYQQTAHYQKLESIVGKSDGTGSQFFPLVDERWEDCIPALNSTASTKNNDVYTYVKSPDGTVKRWINITYKSPGQVANILNDIAFGNGDNHGVYTHENVGNRSFVLVFNNIATPLPLDSLILVRYDDRFPIRVYGGDTYVGEAIFAPLDNQASARDKAAETQFAFGIGLPYKDFKINPRHYTIRKAGGSLGAFNDSIQNKEWFTLGYIRQLCVMFTVESRVAIHLAHAEGKEKQYFPLTHYVIRPNRWEIDKNTVDNHIFPEYDQDYGPDERNQWKWGGFKFIQTINPDYSSVPRIRFFSKPEFGFVEKLKYHTRNMWSLPRVINVQNAPSLKTFPANNSFDIDDNAGEIKLAWSATSGSGENLYAVTETGVCMLITKKTLLQDLNGGNIGYMATDTFIQNQYWLSKTVGCNDEMWRGAAQASVSVKTDAGDVKVDALFIPNKLSVYRLMNNAVRDIAEDYYSKLKPFIDAILPGLATKITGIYDEEKEQYYLHLDYGQAAITFVFSTINDMWIGTNAFRFDKFSQFMGTTYGHRDMQTFTLNRGYIINGLPISYEVLAAAAPEQKVGKEWMRIRINSNTRPSLVQFFYDKNGVVQTFIDPSLSTLALKNYNGYEQWISRVSASVNPERPRLQSRFVLVKIIHNLASAFKISDIAIQFKKLKL